MKVVFVHFACFIPVLEAYNIKFLPKQIIAAARDVQEKTEIYAPYNILPLDSAGSSQPIMQFEEVSSCHD